MNIKQVPDTETIASSSIMCPALASNRKLVCETFHFCLFHTNVCTKPIMLLSISGPAHRQEAFLKGPFSEELSYWPVPAGKQMCPHIIPLPSAKALYVMDQGRRIIPT